MRKSRNISLLIVHCSGTPENRDYTPEMLERDHKARGFATYGYHVYIRRSGQRVLLRDMNMIGAHVTGFNRESIGICYEGGTDAKGNPKDTRTPQQKAEIINVLRELVILYPDAEIGGHRDFSPDKNGDGVIEPSEWIKACPCFDAKKEYRYI